MQRYVRSTVLCAVATIACLPLPQSWAGTRAVDTSSQPPTAAAARARGLVSLDLRQPRGYLRKKLLEYTPKGTGYDEVSSFVQRQLQAASGTAPMTVSRPVRFTTFGPDGDSSSAVRRKRIAAFLGFRHTTFETNTRTAFAAYYAFDESNRLSDVFVVRDEEFLIP